MNYEADSKKAIIPLRQSSYRNDCAIHGWHHLRYLKNFRKAYRYLQERTKHLKYHDYRRMHIPIGSGVTEAACKTVFTQRLKLSGQRWSHEGARRILTLRTILLSGTWESTYGASLIACAPEIRTYQRRATIEPQLAA